LIDRQKQEEEEEENTVYSYLKIVIYLSIKQKLSVRNKIE